MKINYFLPTLLATLIGFTECQRIIQQYGGGDAYVMSDSKNDRGTSISIGQPSSQFNTRQFGQKFSRISPQSRNLFPLLPTYHGMVVKTQNEVKKKSLETDGIFLAADTATVTPAGNNLLNRQSFSDFKKSKNENSILQLTLAVG